MFAFSLLCMLALAIHAQAPTDVPAPVMETFSKEHGDLPPHVKPQWSLEKKSGTPNVLYKVSYMNASIFETYVYNTSGAEVYRRYDCYHVQHANPEAMKVVQAAYPNQKLERISEIRSKRYSIEGFVIKMADKTRYFDITGKEVTANPATAIDKAAFADASNFVDAAPAAPNPSSPKTTDKATTKSSIGR